VKLLLVRMSVCERFVVMNFLSSKAAKQAADTLKTLREDLTIHTDDGAAFPSELQPYIDTYTQRHLETYTDTQRDKDTDTDTMKTLREDLTIHTDDGAAFPSELQTYIDT